MLRLLVVLFSQALYTSTTAPSNENRFLSTLINLPSRKVALALLCSLLNTALSPQSLPPVTAALTNSISTAAASVPGIGPVLSTVPLPRSIPLLTKGPEARREVGALSAFLLDIILLDESEDNVFKRYVGKLHRPADFDFLLDGILALLGRAAEQGGAQPQGEGVGCVQAVVLLWRLIDCNPVRRFSIKTDPNLTECDRNSCLTRCRTHPYPQSCCAPCCCSV